MIRTHSVRSHVKFAHLVFEQFVPRAVAMSFAVILSSPGVGGAAVDLLPADSGGLLIVADQTGGRKPKGKMRLCVRKVEATDAINERYPGSNSLATLLDSLDGQLIQEIQRRRKFEIIADSQLDEVLGTQDRNLGLGADPSAGGVPAVASCQNTLVVRVDDFQDTTVSRKFEGGTVVKARRTLRVGATAQIYREDGSLEGRKFKARFCPESQLASSRHRGLRRWRSCRGPRGRAPARLLWASEAAGRVPGAD